MANKQDELLDSNYEGIQEYDNNLPGWWLVLFYVSIVFSIVYVLYFHVLGIGQLPHAVLAQDMRELEKLRADIESEKQKTQESKGEINLIALASDTTALKEGESVFAAKCAACHGNKGQGLVGPNLADEYWIHGGDVKEIKAIVVNGVLEKGMLAWAGMLSDDEINAVTAYVWSLHGTNPQGGKEPQGELVKRE